MSKPNSKSTLKEDIDPFGDKDPKEGGKKDVEKVSFPLSISWADLSVEGSKVVKDEKDESSSSESDTSTSEEEHGSKIVASSSMSGTQLNTRQQNFTDLLVKGFSTKEVDAFRVFTDNLEAYESFPPKNIDNSVLQAEGSIAFKFPIKLTRKVHETSLYLEETLQSWNVVLNATLSLHRTIFFSPKPNVSNDEENERALIISEMTSIKDGNFEHLKVSLLTGRFCANCLEENHDVSHDSSTCKNCRFCGFSGHRDSICSQRKDIEKYARMERLNHYSHSVSSLHGWRKDPSCWFDDCRAHKFLQEKAINCLKRFRTNYQFIGIHGDYKRYGFFLSPHIGDNHPYYDPYFALKVAKGRDEKGSPVPIFVCVKYWNPNNSGIVELFSTYINHPHLKDICYKENGLSFNEILNKGISPAVARNILLDILEGKRLFVETHNVEFEKEEYNGYRIVTTVTSPDLDVMQISAVDIRRIQLTVIGVKEMFQNSTVDERADKTLTKVNEILFALKGTVHGSMAGKYWGCVVTDVNDLLKIVYWVERLLSVTKGQMVFPTFQEIRFLVDMFRQTRTKRYSSLLCGPGMKQETFLDNYHIYLRNLNFRDMDQTAKTIHHFYERVFNAINDPVIDPNEEA